MAKSDSLSGTLKNILCPIDVEPASICALDLALKLAERDRATIWVMHVTQDYTGTQPVVTVPPQSQIKQSSVREIAYNRLEGRVRYQVIVRHGDAGNEIIRAADEVGADLIVMATHGYTGTLRVLIGSVCDHVMQESGCPLMVVRARQDYVAKAELHLPGIRQAAAHLNERKFQSLMR
ncbi:MAG TPA: universal stress protein [Candidatus Binataceae bacterium]|nr:universal stress protein [Candidatus Binataceae bacterium]